MKKIVIGLFVLLLAGSATALTVSDGGIHLDGYDWHDGAIERVYQSYIYITGNVPPDGNAADVYIGSKQIRTHKPLVSFKNGPYDVAGIDTDGQISGNRIILGPGTGSGNIAAMPWCQGDSCYLAMMGRFNGGGTHPAVHGAVTLGNVNRLGVGEYVFQLRDGDHDDMLVNWNGDAWFSGNLSIGLGNSGNTISGHGGLILDPGPTTGVLVGGSGIFQAGQIKGHTIDKLSTVPPNMESTTYQLGDAETWLDLSCDCVRMTVKTADGIKTTTLPFD